MKQKYLNTHINKLVPFVELFSKALSFISVIIITSLVSVESFGAYYYIVSLVAWASVFMDGGISYYIFFGDNLNSGCNCSYNKAKLRVVCIIIFFLFFIYTTNGFF